MLLNDEVARDPIFTPSAVQINSHCISDRFLPFYFSCAVSGCVPPPPPQPQTPTMGRCGGSGGADAFLFTRGSCVFLVVFARCWTHGGVGGGGSVDGVGGCEAVGAPCRCRVRVFTCPCCVWGVSLGVAFGVTSCCTRSLWEPVGGGSSPWFPPPSPVHLLGADPPVTFSPGDHF